MSNMSMIASLLAVRRPRSKPAQLSQATRTKRYDFALKALCLTGYAGIIFLALKTGAFWDPFTELYATRIGAAAVILATIYAVIMLVFTLARSVAVLCYRPMHDLADSDLPSVSVILPAYNEGPDVAGAIDSIAASDYPQDKLQIIVIDDGSTDDTWQHIIRAAGRHPETVCVIRMPLNGGKRQGLRVGFALAAGDMLVTMDSDSIVEPKSLRRLVTPIAADPRVGAVAGNVKVLNRDAGVLPRMMRAAFVLAFDFTRAHQSMFRTVQCTPGAFSAYRRSAVEAVLHDWNNQRWRGKPSTIAEDRALSNLLLRDGHEIVFQSSAVVWTNVPTTYRGLIRMYQRWERGNVRENLAYAGFFKTHPGFRKRFGWWAHADFALSCSEMMIPAILIFLSLGYGLFHPHFLLQYFAVLILFSGLMQLYYVAREKNSDAIYGVLYSLFWFTCLWWVVPYSVFTANNGGWLTRNKPVAEAPQASAPHQPETPSTPPVRMAA